VSEPVFARQGSELEEAIKQRAKGAEKLRGRRRGEGQLEIGIMECRNHEEQSSPQYSIIPFLPRSNIMEMTPT
jgi:hypothetical protein